MIDYDDDDDNNDDYDDYDMVGENHKEKVVCLKGTYSCLC